MSPVMSPLPGHDYDFDLSIRPFGDRPQSVEREELDAYLSSLPRVRRHEVIGFVLDRPPGRWMEIRPQWRSPEGVEKAAPHGSDRVNYIHLHFPAHARGPERDAEYVRLAFEIAEHLGWWVHDDTDSDDWVSPDLLEAWWPKHRRKPWWKFW